MTYFFKSVPGLILISKSRCSLAFIAIIALSCTEKPFHVKLTDPSIDNETPYSSRLSDSMSVLNADSLFQLGLTYEKLGLVDSALFYYLQEVVSREKVKGKESKLIENYVRIGNSYYKAYSFQSADRFYDKARLLTKRYDYDTSAIIPIYLSAARCKIELKDFPTANSLLYQAFSMLNRPRFKNDSLLAFCYDRLSELNYVNHRYNESIAFLLKEIDIIKNVKPQGVGRLYSNASLIYIAQNKYKEALQFINQSISYDLRWFSPDSDRLAIRYRNKGDIFKLLGLFDSTQFYYLKNLKIRRQIYGNKHINTFGAYNNLGSLFLEQRNYDSAINYFQRSLISFVRDFNELNWHYNPKPSSEEANMDLVIGLVAKADALHRLNASYLSDKDILVTSLNTYLLADSVFNVYRKNTLFEDSQLIQLKENPIPYDKIIEIAFRLHDLTRDEFFLNKAFVIMERSRSVVLQDVLQRAEAYNKTEIPVEFKEKEKEIIRNRSAILMELNKNRNIDKVVDSLNKELLLNHDLQREVEEQLALQNKNYYSIKYGNSFDLHSLMEWLRNKNSVFISYQVSQENIFALIVTSSSVQKETISVDAEFNESFDFIVNDLKENSKDRYAKVHFNKFCKSAYSLYYHLIAKCIGYQESTIEHLIISPDKYLATFPFEALITSEVMQEVVNYNLPYLINKFSVSYALSAGLMKLQSSIPRNGDRLLAFGFGTAASQQDHYDNLPGTISELNVIADLMHNKGNRYYLAQEASESKFKSEVKGFNIVHLALHGVGDTLNTLESRLIFNPIADSLEDGKLYAHELFNLNMDHLDLAVLSACESGIGKQQPGEGIMSIARGFAYAGCPSVIMSLWKIDDRTSASLISNFYQHISEGRSVDDALALAKKDYMTSANELSSHPFYWAAFIQIGDPRTIENSGFSWWVWLIVSGVVFLIIILLYKRLKLYDKGSSKD